MNNYIISEIRSGDKRNQRLLDALLVQEDIRRDANLDYTVGIFDKEYRLIATGSVYANTLRCLAVDSKYQGEGLLNKIVTHLIDYQVQRGNTHLFIYTKVNTANFFSDLGFQEIARVADQVVFMENTKTGFSTFLEKLSTTKGFGTTAALVMNCNPFTLGHQYLVEYTAKENDIVHLFIVSEDTSLFPFQDRFRLVKEGCAHLKNVVLHETDSYMISSAVFPSYFLEDEESVISAHGRLDTALFVQIANAIGATKRYVGDEPFSKVTNIYNNIMKEELPKHGIEVIVIPRKELHGTPISASHVRQLIHDDKLEEIKTLVPQSTYDYFFTSEGIKTMDKIQNAETVIHY